MSELSAHLGRERPAPFPVSLVVEQVASQPIEEVAAESFDRDDIILAAERARAGCGMMLGVSIAILVLINLGLKLWRDVSSSVTQTPVSTPTPPSVLISCSDVTIVGLELRSGLILSSDEVFTSTISSFSLHPQTEPELGASACEFEWSLFFEDCVVTFRDTKFTSDRRELVDGEEVLLLEKSKCHLVFSVAPFDELRQEGVNPKAFEIVVSECSYKK